MRHPFCDSIEIDKGWATEIAHQVAIDLFEVVCRESYAVVVYITTHQGKKSDFTAY